MGYKVDLRLREHVGNKNGISMQVDEEFLQGKSVGDVISYMLENAQDRTSAGAIEEIWKREPIIFNMIDNRPLDNKIEVGDRALTRVIEDEEDDEVRGHLDLVLYKTDIIG